MGIYHAVTRYSMTKIAHQNWLKTSPFNELEAVFRFSCPDRIGLIAGTCWTPGGIAHEVVWPDHKISRVLAVNLRRADRLAV